MKHTITILSAAIFATAMALPAFAQMDSTSSSSVKESTTEIQNVPPPAPVVNSVTKESSEYKSDNMGGPAMTSKHVVKEATETSSSAPPPPPAVEKQTVTHSTETHVGY